MAMMAEDDASGLDFSSSGAVSPSTTSVAKPQRDMKAELLAWKQEKANRMMQQKSTKSQTPQPFRVPRSAVTPCSENVPIKTAKTPSRNSSPRKVVSRPALGERCTNTYSSAGGLASPRSASPPHKRYTPAPRPTVSMRTKSPESSRVPKTPETKRPPAPGSAQHPVRRAVSPTLGRPVQRPAAPAQDVEKASQSPQASAEVSPPKPVEMATQSPQACGEVSPTKPVETARQSPQACAEVTPLKLASPSPQVTASQSPQVSAEVSPLKLASPSPQGSAEASPLKLASPSPQASAEASPLKPVDMASQSAQASVGLSPLKPVEAAAEEVETELRRQPEPAIESQVPGKLVEAEECGETDENKLMLALGEAQEWGEASEAKPRLVLGACSSSSPPPPPPHAAAPLPPAPIGSPPELPPIEAVTSAKELAGKESSEESSDESSETSETSSGQMPPRTEADVSAEVAAELPREMSEPSARAPSPAPAHVALAPSSPSPTGGSLLAAYLPAASQGLSASPSVAARTGGGLLSAYEERAEVPRMPPPSPATPSTVVAFALKTAAAMPDCGAKAEAAEFARIAGVALGRLAAAESGESSGTPARGSGEALTTPRPVVPSIVEEAPQSPAAPLSPLSLESQSPEPSIAALSPAAVLENDKGLEDVKLET